MNTGNSAKKKANLTKLYTLSEGWVQKPKLNKTIAAKYEDWNIRLKIINSEAEIIKNSLQAKDKDVAALHVSFKELEKKFKALCKEVQKLQKTFTKKRDDINSKLLFVIDTIDSSNKILFDATKANCKTIIEGIELSKTRLNNILKIVAEFDIELRNLGQRLAKLLLPLTVETCAEMGKDLKERLEEIHRTAATMTAEELPIALPASAAASPASASLSGSASSPISGVVSGIASGPASGTPSGAAASFNPSGIQKNLTLLRDSCTAGIKLIDLVHANVSRVFLLSESARAAVASGAAAVPVVIPSAQGVPGSLASAAAEMPTSPAPALAVPSPVAALAPVAATTAGAETAPLATKTVVLEESKRELRVAM